MGPFAACHQHAVLLVHAGIDGKLLEVEWRQCPRRCLEGLLAVRPCRLDGSMVARRTLARLLLLQPLGSFYCLENSHACARCVMCPIRSNSDWTAAPDGRGLRRAAR